MKAEAWLKRSPMMKVKLGSRMVTMSAMGCLTTRTKGKGETLEDEDKDGSLLDVGDVVVVLCVVDVDGDVCTVDMGP